MLLICVLRSMRGYLLGCIAWRCWLLLVLEFGYGTRCTTDTQYTHTLAMSQVYTSSPDSEAIPSSVMYYQPTIRVQYSNVYKACASRGHPGGDGNSSCQVRIPERNR